MTRPEATTLSFRPIDLERHADRCIAFRRDSFVSSFGTDEAFVEKCGADGAGYIAWLREHRAAFPDGFVHVWDGDTLVGQMEMRVRDDPQIGYVNLFYLIAAVRGRGLGDQLHEYALRFFRGRDVATIQLSVSPTNRRALAYYQKHGWRDLGPRPGREQVHLMERASGGSSS